ncbi:hypothetical protein [Chitinophaga nivalis]|uniref:EF-hand domain-containing protein n=1 Tax=Chitinophaga nivalis TaxID=2991709 RepID=A0ABT3IUD8_9BACT|nr:hypothetical protein [Chitinophaga nivalis]MCW3462734.1 hypothetical protein [Chitinophaga nivalis]MCW3487575.1 hypothetical protein [Chitinophaga nivalis]
MLEQLMQLVREQAQDTVVNNPAVPNENNDAVIGAATESITSGLQQELANGNAAGVLSLLGGHSGDNVATNPLVSNISNNFVGTLLEKFNLDKGVAQQLAASLIPGVLGSLINKTNDPANSSFSLDGILGSLTGSSTQGINLQGILGKLKGGLDQDGDGDVDFNDLKGLLSNGARQQQGNNTNNDGGGIGGLLKGLLG